MRKALLILALVLCNTLVFREIGFLNAGLSEKQVYFLDVGQGDSELISLRGANFLIDGGPDKKVLYELDQALGASRRYLDMVFLSHPQADHLDGLREVLKSYEIGIFIYAEEQESNRVLKEWLEHLLEEGVPTIGLKQGDRIVFKDSRIEVLSPGSEGSEDVNESSLVLLLDTGFGKVLFTGDIGAATEKRITKKRDVSAEVLKVGHHGSKYSSSEEFLNEVRPTAAVIEVGKNSYGHPAPEAVKRLAKSGAEVYRTDLLGTVKLVFGKEGFKFMKIR